MKSIRKHIDEYNYFFLEISKKQQAEDLNNSSIKQKNYISLKCATNFNPPLRDSLGLQLSSLIRGLPEFALPVVYTVLTSGSLLRYHFNQAMVFMRPSIPYPSVWHRFSITRGSTISFRVQDLTEDLYETALDLLTKYFTRDEPPCKYIEINNHPRALSELQKLWRKTLQDNVSLVCVVDHDGPLEVVGVNVLTVACKDDGDEPFQTDDEVWAQLFGAVDLVSRGVNIFEMYDVDKYLNAYGLVVDPKWRGMNVGKEILKARIPLCKAMNIKITATVFTAGASQAIAKKAGFVDLYEVPYEEMAKKGICFPGIEEDTNSSKLMALLIE